MKLLTVIACVGVAALSSTRVEAADTCVPNCAEIYKPVCGSDGKTYENQCALDYKKCSTKNEALTVVAEGECAASTSGSAGGIVGSNCVKGCPKIMMPVCGSDGKTYNNECELTNAKCTNTELTLASKGECGSTAGSAGADCSTTQCLMDYTPVCGSDGTTYSNECKLENEKCTNLSLTLASMGECGGTSKMGSVAGEASEAGSEADASDVSSTPPTSVPTSAPNSAATTVCMQAAATMIVVAVASALL